MNSVENKTAVRLLVERSDTMASVASSKRIPSRYHFGIYLVGRVKVSVDRIPVRYRVFTVQRNSAD